jgi:hypothetical protein
MLAPRLAPRFGAGKILNREPGTQREQVFVTGLMRGSGACYATQSASSGGRPA